MENFKVGDRVVCVDTSSNDFVEGYPNLILNREYIVYSTANCSKCSVQYLDVGFPSDVMWLNCKCGMREARVDNIHWCGSWRFRKVAEKVEYIAVAVNVEIEEPVLN
jgi:hypothetical protein